MLGLLTVRFEEHGGKGAAALPSSACRVAELGVGLIHGGMLLLVGCLLLTQARVVDGGQLPCSLALGAVVHQSLDSLFTLEACGLHLVERGVHDLPVHSLELAEVSQVDLHI